MPESTNEQKQTLGGDSDPQGAASDEAQRAADSVAKEFLVHLGRRIKEVAGKMRDESLQEAVRTTTTKVADRLESAGSYLEEQRFQNVADDLTSVIRRYPLPSILVGLAVGFLLARRGGK